MAFGYTYNNFGYSSAFHQSLFIEQFHNRFIHNAIKIDNSMG